MISQYQGSHNIQKYYDEGPKDFPNVPENHFELKDQETINELNQLQQKNLQIENPVLRLGGTKEEQQNFKARQDQLMATFDKLQNDIPRKAYSTPYKHYDYYNLEHVQFDEQQSIADAFAFLKQLEKRNQQDEMQNELDKLSIDYKPQYVPKQKSADAMNEEDTSQMQQNTKKITKRMQLLSFQDEHDD